MNITKKEILSALEGTLEETERMGGIGYLPYYFNCIVKCKLPFERLFPEIVEQLQKDREYLEDWMHNRSHLNGNLPLLDFLILYVKDLPEGAIECPIL